MWMGCGVRECSGHIGISQREEVGVWLDYVEELFGEWSRLIGPCPSMGPRQCRMRSLPRVGGGAVFGLLGRGGEGLWR